MRFDDGMHHAVLGVGGVFTGEEHLLVYVDIIGGC